MHTWPIATGSAIRRVDLRCPRRRWKQRLSLRIAEGCVDPEEDSLDRRQLGCDAYTAGRRLLTFQHRSGCWCYDQPGAFACCLLHATHADDISISGQRQVTVRGTVRSVMTALSTNTPAMCS